MKFTIPTGTDANGNIVTHKKYSKNNYQADNGNITLPYEVSKVNDRLGGFYVLECSGLSCRKEINTLEEVRDFINSNIHLAD